MCSKNIWAGHGTASIEQNLTSIGSWAHKLLVDSQGEGAGDTHHWWIGKPVYRNQKRRLYECMFTCVAHQVVLLISLHLVASVDLADLLIGNTFKWFVSQTPYLIHKYSKAPHIAGSGVLLVHNSLGHTNFTSIIIIITWTDTHGKLSLKTEFCTHTKKNKRKKL